MRTADNKRTKAAIPLFLIIIIAAIALLAVVGGILVGTGVLARALILTGSRMYPLRPAKSPLQMASRSMARLTMEKTTLSRRLLYRTAPSLVIDDEIAPDNEATVNSDIVTSEVENESEALAREAETGKTPNTDKMDLQSTDGISSTLENSELDESFSHTTDSSMAESRPDENVSLMAA